MQICRIQRATLDEPVEVTASCNAAGGAQASHRCRGERVWTQISAFPAVDWGPIHPRFPSQVDDGSLKWNYVKSYKWGRLLMWRDTRTRRNQELLRVDIECWSRWGARENAVWLKTSDVMNQDLFSCLDWAVYVHPLPKVGQDCCVKGRGSSALTYWTL